MKKQTKKTRIARKIAEVKLDTFEEGTYDFTGKTEEQLRNECESRNIGTETERLVATYDDLKEAIQKGDFPDDVKADAAEVDGYEYDDDDDDEAEQEQEQEQEAPKQKQKQKQEAPKQEAEQEAPKAEKKTPKSDILNLGALAEALMPELNQRLDELELKIENSGSTESRLTVEIDGMENEIKGCVHPEFDRALRLLKRYHILYMVGASGSGKSFMARQLAEALGLPFYSISCSVGMSEGALLGKMTAQGEYLPATFVKAYEEGGVFLMDEIAASDPNVLIVQNDATANDRLSVPNRTEKPYAMKHKDFYLIGADNTFGSGASFTYTARNKLDLSTLDRFVLSKIIIDYDEQVEKMLLGFDTPKKPQTKYKAVKRTKAQLTKDLELFYSGIVSLRSWIDANKVKRIVSTRAVKHGGIAIADGDTLEQVYTDLFVDWSESERNKGLQHLKSQKFI